MNYTSDESVSCCPDERKVTPLQIQNPPRLSEIMYRVGTFSSFKASMLSAISRKAELSKLTTRSDDDLSIALLDAWATIGDVLTFYQERIANEGFLRTAKERRSVKELASTVGYQLSSGVAASTYLAFTVEESGIVKETRIQAGTKAQSLPGPDQMSQIFETIESLTARPEFNNLRPRFKKLQEITENKTYFIFEGTNLAIEPGDGLLLLTYVSTDTVRPSFRIVSEVTEDPMSKRTTVHFVANLHRVAEQRIRVGTARLATGATPSLQPKREKLFNISAPDATALQYWISHIKNQSDLDSIAVEQGVDPDKIASAINSDMTRAADDTTIGFPSPEVYVFRIRSGAFGNRAPLYRSRPDENGPPILETIRDIAINKKNSTEYHDPKNRNLIYLDNSYPSIGIKSWVVVRGEKVDQHNVSLQIYVVYQVSDTIEKSLSLEYFDMSATTMGLRLDTEPLDTNGLNNLKHFTFRESTIYSQSEQLRLSLEDDISPIIGENTIVLDKTVLGLTKGMPVVISGKIISLDGVPTGLEASDIAVISNIVQEGAFTKLIFEKPIEKNFDKKTITLNANVARATHGETKNEVLGSGDPSKQYQEFILKNKPLTYVSSTNASGAESTLEVRIDKILWKEVPSFYKASPDEHVYITRTNEDNRTHVIFGDGSKGGRPTAGMGNIEAKYRVGMGSDGMVEQGQISILISRALGVKSVTNPTKPSGAEDLEDLKTARQNAPLSAITMNRNVSFEDFEYFARAFKGIEKAQAIWLWDGQRNIIHLTVAPSSGDPLEDTSSLRANLIKGINISKDPMALFRVDTFIPRFFNLNAKILIAKDRQQEDVLRSVTTALVKEFSFKSRELGQPVTKSEIVALIQSIDGVIASDIDALYLVSDRNISTEGKEEEERTEDLIPTSLAHLENGKVLGAELLMLNSKGLSLSVMYS